MRVPLRVRRLPLLVAVVALAAAAAAGPPPVVTVSPGEADRTVEIASACPTFSWAGVPGASGFELVVLDLAASDEQAVVLRREIPGAASSWTPASADCLHPGAEYAWSVRALDAAGQAIGGGESWAALRRFAVPALPSQADLAAALETLRRWQAGTAAGAGKVPGTLLGPRGSGAGKTVEAPGTAAIYGENPATSGLQHGVIGQTSSPAGAGLVAANLDSGPDLILDGAAAGFADARLTEKQLDRPSATGQGFDFMNSLGGGMQLTVNGAPVALEGHVHSGAAITSGTVADARIAATLARDSEVMPLVLAGDGPGSTLDADTLDGAHRASLQPLVTGVCPVGQAIRGINPDGSVVCYEVPVPPKVSTVDDPAATDVGTYTSLRVRSNGRPIISYRDVSNTALKLAFCADDACVFPTPITLDNAADVGEYTSLAIGADGFPVVSYSDLTNTSLKVIWCNDSGCSGGDETITTVDNTGAVGQHTSLAIGTDGFPVISYFGPGTLKVAKCNNASCSNTTISTVDGGGALSVGTFTSIAIGTDGFPVISYNELGTSNLRVAKCNDAACAGANETITVVEEAGATGLFTSIAIGGDGFPVISYYSAAAPGLKVAKCNDAACSGLDETISVVSSAAQSGTSLRIGTDGYPVIAFRVNDGLLVAKCNDAACTGGDETVSRVENGTVGEFPSLAIAQDGFPVISYYDRTNGALKVAKCKNASCRY